MRFVYLSHLSVFHNIEAAHSERAEQITVRWRDALQFGSVSACIKGTQVGDEII